MWVDRSSLNDSWTIYESLVRKSSESRRLFWRFEKALRARSSWRACPTHGMCASTAREAQKLICSTDLRRGLAGMLRLLRRLRRLRLRGGASAPGAERHHCPPPRADHRRDEPGVARWRPSAAKDGRRPAEALEASETRGADSLRTRRLVGVVPRDRTPRPTPANTGTHARRSLGLNTPNRDHMVHAGATMCTFVFRKFLLFFRSVLLKNRFRRVDNRFFVDLSTISQWNSVVIWLLVLYQFPNFFFNSKLCNNLKIFIQTLLCIK